MHFIEQIERFLEPFLPYAEQQINLRRPCFSRPEQTVGQFTSEIRQTFEQLKRAQHPHYAEIYAQKLLEQFDALNAQLPKLKQPKPSFNSSYHFSSNIHRLPPAKRLVEYRQALRLLNEKISWLLEQQYQTQFDRENADFSQLIAETEYRKQKCLNAIEELEESLKFK